MSDADYAEAVTGAACLDALAALERQIAALQAQRYRLLARIDRAPVTTSLPGTADKRWAVEDVACVLRMSPASARALLAEAAEAARLPRVLDLLSAGAISAGHVRVLTDATTTLDDSTARAVVERVADRAPAHSVATFRSAVRRAVLAIAAPTLEQRRRANLAERRVCVRRAGEGTSELWALLPDEGAAALIAAINALADVRDRGDERTVDQRRADALVQLGLDSLAGEISTVLPRRQRLGPAVQVTVALATLLRLNNEPGELNGIGLISAELARRLADDPSGTWRRLVTDPVGRLVDYGRRVYRPPTALARHVIARDRTCRFPHCTRAAARSELDHTVSWREGGRTDEANLTALCARHHHLRHETRWRYRRAHDGTTQWTSPAGRRYDTPAATYPTDPAPVSPMTMDVNTSESATSGGGPDPPPF